MEQVDIALAEAGGGDPDQHLPWTGNRSGNFLDGGLINIEETERFHDSAP